MAGANERFHGFSRNQNPSQRRSSPIVLKPGVIFAIGTSPVQMTGGRANTLYRLSGFDDAKAQIGYSDDWDSYTLSEVVYNAFLLNKGEIDEIVVVNALDPDVHRTDVPEQVVAVHMRKARLPQAAISDSVTVKSQDGSVTYVNGTDYALYFADSELIIELLLSGQAPAATELTVGYSKVDPGKVDEFDIIGGVDIATGRETGLELLRRVYPTFQIYTDIVIAPGWSTKNVIAAIAAKVESVNGFLKIRGYVDVDTDTVRRVSDIGKWKADNNVNYERIYAVWLRPALGAKVYYGSTAAAVITAITDRRDDDTPTESPSNKVVRADRAVLKDGTAIMLDPIEANAVNTFGVATFIRMAGSYRLFGNDTTIYPEEKTDESKYILANGRTFDWLGNSFVLTYWEALDKKMSYRLVESIVDDYNYLLNSLKGADKIAGGEILFDPRRNPLDSLLRGKIVFHIKAGTYPPMSDVGVELEYDVSYLAEAFS